MLHNTIDGGSPEQKKKKTTKAHAGLGIGERRRMERREVEHTPFGVVPMAVK